MRRRRFIWRFLCYYRCLMEVTLAVWCTWRLGKHSGVRPSHWLVVTNKACPSRFQNGWLLSSSSANCHVILIAPPAVLPHSILRGHHVALADVISVLGMLICWVLNKTCFLCRYTSQSQAIAWMCIQVMGVNGKKSRYLASCVCKQACVIPDCHALVTVIQ